MFFKCADLELTRETQTDTSYSVLEEGGKRVTLKTPKQAGEQLSVKSSSRVLFSPHWRRVSLKMSHAYRWDDIHASSKHTVTACKTET